jgi:hypothetical protein
LQEQLHRIGVDADGFHNIRGTTMSWPHIYDRARAQPQPADGPRTRYVVVRQEDVWFIHFDGEEYGPYRTEREAMLFAIEAAYKLGELGEETQVRLLDENGDARPAWTFGRDPYPPRL